MLQAETLLRRWLLDAVPILRTQDISTTMLRPTMAGLWGLLIDPVPIVVREFLTCLNILARHNPDGVAKLFGLAVWVTRMVDKACGVLERTPINSIPLIQAEDINVTCG
jgi:hypothetical protein